MNVKELRALSADELNQKEKELKKELFALNYQRHLGQVEKPARFHNLRIEIARILTILKERELDGAKK